MLSICTKLLILVSKTPAIVKQEVQPSQETKRQILWSFLCCAVNDYYSICRKLVLSSRKNSFVFQDHCFCGVESSFGRIIMYWNWMSMIIVFFVTTVVNCSQMTKTGMKDQPSWHLFWYFNYIFFLILSNLE